MRYKQSEIILKKIKAAKKILIGCHRNPDPDSVGSALAMQWVLKGLGKEVKVVSPTEIVKTCDFLEGFKKIAIIDFEAFDFAKWDLFITLDSSSWDMATGIKEFNGVGISTVVIDHHSTNEKFGQINLVDSKMTSTGELLYWIFKDWGIDINQNIASALLTGIIGDTGIFRFPNTGSRTYKIGAELMDLGADKDKIVFNLFNRSDIELIRVWGKVLSNIKIDKKHKFYYVAISYSIFNKLGSPSVARESAASQFGNIIEGTDFSIFMFEQEKDVLSVSFRSRTGFDTSQIALALGGGGHVYASGAKIENMPFEKAVEKVLIVARKYAKL